MHTNNESLANIFKDDINLLDIVIFSGLKQVFTILEKLTA